MDDDHNGGDHSGDRPPYLDGESASGPAAAVGTVTAEPATPVDDPPLGQLAAVHDLPAEHRAARRAELDRLGDEICTLAGHIAAATARFLRLLGEFEQAEAWRDWGVRSCAHWLSWRCAMDLRTAREHVRVARAMRDLPRTTEAFEHGELSFSKVRALSRVATADTEDDLLGLATHATAAQVERICQGLRTAARTCGAAEVEEVLAGEPLGPPRTMYGARWRWDPDTGDLLLWGRFSPEEGAVMLAAITRAEAERTRTFVPVVDAAVDGSGDAPAGAGEQHADAALAPDQAEHPHPATPDVAGGPPNDPGPALVAMALMTLEAIQAPVMAPAAEVVFVHQLSGAAQCPAEHHHPADGPAEHHHHPGDGPAGHHHHPGDSPAEHHQPADGPAEHPSDCTTRVYDGPALDRYTGDLVQCTAHARDVVMSDGAVLAYGRRRRKASPHQLRALLLRDGGMCQAPGCGRTRFLHAHHVTYWSRNGRTDLANLILLCSSCHTLVHLGRLSIVAAGRQRFEFRDPSSGQLIPSSPPTRGRADELLRGRRIEPGTIAGGWDGTLLDLSSLTEGLLGRWLNRRDRAGAEGTDAA